MTITISGTTLTYNDGSATQSASTFGSVGTYAIVGLYSTSSLKSGDTIAGSSLAYISGTILVYLPNQSNQTMYLSGYGYTNPGKWTIMTAYNQYWDRQGTNFNGTQFSDTIGSGASTLSGTWRAMNNAVRYRYETSYDGYAYTSYLQQLAPILVVRIS